MPGFQDLGGGGIFVTKFYFSESQFRQGLT